MKSKSLHKRIDDEVAGDNGWWQKSTGKTYRDAGDKLKSLGMDDDDIIELLQSLFFAAAAEYGE